MDCKLQVILMLTFSLPLLVRPSNPKQCDPCEMEGLEIGNDVHLQVSCYKSLTPAVAFENKGTSGPNEDTGLIFATIMSTVECNCTSSAFNETILQSQTLACGIADLHDTLSLPHAVTPGTTCTFWGCYEYHKFYTFGFSESGTAAIEPTSCIVDIDECRLGTHNCDENAECTNIIGSFECNCSSGYEGNGTYCTNIDECAGGTHQCDENADCADTDGNYNCSCHQGFEGDGFSCNDIDECPGVECDNNATCINTPGSYDCECDTGYEGDGYNCTNINECEKETHICENAFCKDTDGSYNCICEPGYENTEDPFNCTDIDECATEMHECSENASCNNTLGSYGCMCESGYTGDGVICTDIDECAAEMHECSENASCNNTLGSYSCMCESGYTGDGVTCTAEQDDSLLPVHTIVVLVICALTILLTGMAGTLAAVCYIAKRRKQKSEMNATNGLYKVFLRNSPWKDIECPVDPYEFRWFEEIESVFDQLERNQDKELVSTLCSVSMDGIPGADVKEDCTGSITGLGMTGPDVDGRCNTSIPSIKSDDRRTDMEKDFADKVSSESGAVKAAEATEDEENYETEFTSFGDEPPQVALGSTCPQDTTGTSGGCSAEESDYLLNSSFVGHSNINSGSNFPDSSGGSQFAAREISTSRFTHFSTLNNFRTSNQALSSCGYVTSGSANTTGCLTLTSFTDESGFSLPELCESPLSDYSSFINQMLISTDEPDLTIASQNEDPPMHMINSSDTLPQECCKLQTPPLHESPTPNSQTSTTPLHTDITGSEDHASNHEESGARP